MADHITLAGRIYFRAGWPLAKRFWTTRLARNPRYAQGVERVHNRFTRHHRTDWVPSGVELVHVPKTGGTSVRHMLESLGHPTADLHRPMPPAALGPLLDGQEPSARFVTFLRDPVARVWSMFWMAKEGGPWQGLASDLRLFLDACWEARNEYVQYLTGRPRVEVGGQDLDVAKTVLRGFWFVGDFARFDDEAIRLAGALGGNVGSVPRLRSERRYRAPTADEAALIADHNRLDIALYDWWRMS